MAVGELVLLLGAGVGAGICGSAAGLASLVSYPVLLLIGLPPVTANVTNTVALIGSSTGSVSRSRPELSGQGARIRRLLPLAVLGGAGGAALLLRTPAGTFEVVVPFLIALASTLLLIGPRLRARSTAARSTAARSTSDRPIPDRAATHPGTAHPPTTRPPATHLPTTAAGRSAERGPAERGPADCAKDADDRASIPVRLGLTATFVYGGYFGAAAGVMALALLVLATDLSLARATAVRNLLLGVANGTAAIGFAIFSDVRWLAALPLGVGCVLGGMLGPSIVRRVPPTVLRVIIAAAGYVLAVRLWLS